MNYLHTRFFFSLLLSIFCFSELHAQNEFHLRVFDEADKSPLVGITVIMDRGKDAQSTDANGDAFFRNIPNGKHEFIFRMIGYDSVSKAFTFPIEKYAPPYIIEMQAQGEELEEVQVSSTRTNSRLEEQAVKIEVLGEDDMVEENGIKPGNITSLLGDISIIHIQQTSQTSGNSVLRMQGLDGRYTQLLRDGLPLYEGLSSGLGILQIPPLDLKQIEVVKGSTSTLYGGGAIAGMINLVSKSPTDSPALAATINYSSLQEGNFNVYTSFKKKKFGMTIFAGTTQQEPRDVNNDGFTDVARVRNGIWHPRFFIYFNPKTSLAIGVNGLYEQRTGGDLKAITHRADTLHRFYEQQNTLRNSIDIILHHQINEQHSIEFKALGSSVWRQFSQSGLKLQGLDNKAFAEFNHVWKTRKNTLVTGLAYTADLFVPLHSDSSTFQKQYFHTGGFFIQDDWQAAKWVVIQPGFRLDYNNRYGLFTMPRLAFLFKPARDLVLRLSAGSGYKTPNIFSFSGLSNDTRFFFPGNTDVRPEISYGANFDVQYKARLFDAVVLQLDQAFYYTYIQRPIFARFNTSGIYALENAGYFIDSRGTDTYVRLSWKDLEVYLGYNHTIAKQRGSGANGFVPYSPHDKFSAVISYEIPEKWRFGIESGWVGTQYTETQKETKGYFVLAAMIEKKFKQGISLVLNGENLLDVRQSRWESLYTGSISNPQFKSLYAPIDGWVLNLSIHWRIRRRASIDG